MNQVLEYDAKVDIKKRITLRDTKYDYYHVKTYEDGTISLSPRVLTDPQVASKKIKEVVKKMRKNAVENGTADMSLEEINDIIYGK